MNTVTSPPPTALLNNRPQLTAPHRPLSARLPERWLEASSPSAPLRAPSRTVLGSCRRRPTRTVPPARFVPFFLDQRFFFLPSLFSVSHLAAGSRRAGLGRLSSALCQRMARHSLCPAPTCAQRLHPPLQGPRVSCGQQTAAQGPGQDQDRVGTTQDPPTKPTLGTGWEQH